MHRIRPRSHDALKRQYVSIQRRSSQSVTHSQWHSNAPSIGRRPRPFVDCRRYQSTSTRIIGDERQLEKFTINALNSRVVPIGSMDNALWNDTVHAIDGWFEIGGGFGLDSAGRLIHRLDAEFSVLNPFGDLYHTKSETLMRLYSTLLRSWIDTFAQHSQSQLALIKAEDVLRRQITRQAFYSGIFPIEELVVILEGLLMQNNNNAVATEKVASLLLFATDHTEDFDNDMTPYFNIIQTKLKDDSHLYEAIIERMKHLVEKASWNALDVPGLPREKAEEFLSVANDPQDRTTTDEKTPADYRERVVHEINNAEDNQGPMIERLVNKYIEENGMDDRVMDRLIDFFLRTEDADRASHWIQLQTDSWEKLGGVEKARFVQQATQLIVLEQQVTPVVEKVLGRLKSEASVMPATLFASLFPELSERAANPKTIVEVLNRLSGFDGNLNLPLHKSAVQALFKYDKKALDDIARIYAHVLKSTQQSPQVTSPAEFGDFLHGILSMLAYRNLFNEAEEYLRKAEHALLQSNAPEGAVSMISIDCYQRLIQRKWYTPKTAPRVISTFRRLKAIYHSGYSNLLPNQEIFTAYARAVSTIEKDASKVERALEEMLELHMETGDDSVKPSTEIVQIILLSYRQDANKVKVAGTKSLELLDRMKSLEVTPDTKCLNYVMQCVNRSSNDDVYQTVLEIYSMFDQYGLEADSFSRHSLMDACASARGSNQDAALTTALETFGQIRQDDQVGPQTYPILTRVLLRVLAKGSERADKVATTVFRACCDDGYWQSEGGPLKKRFKSLFSRSAWHDVYTKQLDTNKNEPRLWSRNIK